MYIDFKKHKNLNSENCVLRYKLKNIKYGIIIKPYKKERLK